MSGIRDHKLYKITISGERTFVPRDAYGEVCGEAVRVPFTDTRNVIASLSEIAHAHVQYWLQFSDAIMETVTVSVDNGTKIHAFIEEHVW